MSDPTPFPVAALRGMSCPYCGARLALDSGSDADAIRFGIVRCACQRYPVIDGILVLRPTSGAGAEHFGEALDQLERNQTRLALRAALWFDNPTSHRGLARFLERNGLPFSRRIVERRTRLATERAIDDPALTFGRALELLRWAPYSHYLAQRFANPSFLAAIPLLALLDGRVPGNRVLDVASGTGHAAWVVRAMFPALEVVSVDRDFVNLWLGHRFVNPGATAVCTDAEAPLPFADGSFGAVLCLDALHYIRGKRALVRELDRVTARDALWLLPHVHNAAVESVSHGMPLRPDDWRELLGSVDHRVVLERDLLTNALADDTVDLTADASPAALAGAEAMSFVGCRAPGVFARHEGALAPLRKVADVAINPIYAVEEHADHIELRMRWPNPRLEQECAMAREFLPERYRIERALWSRMSRGERNGADQPRIDELVRRLVLVPLPPGSRTLPRPSA